VGGFLEKLWAPGEIVLQSVALHQKGHSRRPKIR
jgi:hypothetical protein